MDEYGKLFKKFKIDSQVEFFLRPYNPDNEKYFEMIKKAQNEGFKQVIINSEIMTNILYSIIESDGLILKINMSENTDQDIIDNIKSIIPKLKKNKLLFVKLKEQLEWASESGSIDIHSIEIYVHNKKYQIYSNGILYGEELIMLFENILRQVLVDYFI